MVGVLLKHFGEIESCYRTYAAAGSERTKTLIQQRGNKAHGRLNNSKHDDSPKQTGY
jgi:hypothetical protein